MKWIFTLTLLALTASAQLPSGPDLRVVTGREGYPGLTGIAGLPPHGSDTRSLTLWSHGENEILLAFNLELVNIGDEPWTPLTQMSHIYYAPWFTRPKLAVAGLFHFALSTTNGVVVVERTSNAEFFQWDVFPVFGGLPRNFGWFMPGVSPGRAGSGWSPLQAETFLNIFGVPNGDYVLSVEPGADWAGLFPRVEVGLSLENYQITFR